MHYAHCSGRLNVAIMTDCTSVPRANDAPIEPLGLAPATGGLRPTGQPGPTGKPRPSVPVGGAGTSRQRAIGLATILVSAMSSQTGAAIGARAFDGIGPAGVVAVRQLVAAAVLAVVAPPRFRSLTRRQWWPVLLLAVVFGTMNVTLYTAIDRIGLALAVTLEFLGPLGVALATARSKLAAVCGLGAGAGVVVLTAPGPTSDVLGIGLGLASAAAWACYILLNRTIGSRLPGLQGASTAASLSAAMWLPIAILILVARPLDLAALGMAFACGVLSSAIPFMADLVTLRRVPTDLFGVLMSVHPMYAALAGYLILGQALSLNEWVGIAVIIVSNVVITWASRARSPAPSSRRRCRQLLGNHPHPGPPSA